MKRKRFILFAIIMAAFALFVGCKKEKTEEKNPSASEACVGMLHFNSAEEFRETQEKVLAMSETERREWERQQGFKSFATKCEELFEGLEAKGINSDEDIYSFVKENSDYFYIREEEGEKYLTSYLEYSSYYQFVDENRMLRIGDNVIKVFDEGVVTAPVINENNLLNVTSFYETAQECFNYYENFRPEFHIGTKDDDDGCNCGSQETIVRKTNDNGYERTYVRFYIDNDRIVTGDTGFDDFVYQQGYRYVCYRMKVRPYRKNFGIWFWCQRTITYNVNYSVYDNAEFRLVTDNKQGQDGGGKIDVLLHSFEGFWSTEYYSSITGHASTPNASCVITCSTIY